MKKGFIRTLAVFLILSMMLSMLPVLAAEPAAVGDIVLADQKGAVPIYIDRDSDDYDGLSLVATAVAGDFEAITGSRSKVHAVATAPEAKNQVLEPEIKDNIVSKLGNEAVVIIAGTLNDELIKGLNQEWDITPSNESFKAEDFERYQIKVLKDGAQTKIVVAGADKRGTSYGLFHITQDLCGVSPWIWWADVAPAQQDSLAFSAEELETVSKRPSVNYRGFFFNDENPNLDGFADSHFGGLNYLFYDHVFELMLRLKGNFLWPAMWSNSFNSDGVEGIANANTGYASLKNSNNDFAKLELENHYLLGGAMYVDQPGNENAACGAPNVNTTNYTKAESEALGDGSLEALQAGEYPMTLANAVLADRYGVMVGASHHEPMARAGVEWGNVQGYYGSTDTYTQPTASGATDKNSRQEWNYLLNPTNISNFWSDGIKRNGSFDNLLTIGMRGENDEALTGSNGQQLSTKENAELLKDVIREQDRILRQYGLEDTPQLVALYKEVENCWYAGNRNSPENVDKNAALYYDEEITDLLGADTNRIVMFCEDNNGYLRTVGEYGEKERFNYGLYYHFDYVGAPHTSMWTNTMPLQRTWDNLTTAYEYGVDDAWIVNVGDLKPMELPLSYFMEMAYDFETYGSNASVDTEDTITWEEFTEAWVQQQFAAAKLREDEAKEIASILTDYTHLNGNRKPEQHRRDTYSLTSYNEAQEIMALAKSIEKRANKYLERFEGTELYDAFYQLVYYTAIESATVNQLMVSWGLNQYYSGSGSALTNIYADKVDSLLAADRSYTAVYNTLGSELNGQNKWYRMMITSPFHGERVLGIEARAHLNYSGWNNESSQTITPSRVNLAAGASMLVNVTGSNVVSSGTLSLPEFDNNLMQAYALTLSNKGVEKYTYTVSELPAWVKLDGELTGTVQTAKTLGLSIDWSKVTETVSGSFTVSSDSGQSVSVKVTAKVAELPAELPEGTAVMSNGEFSFIASNYTDMGTGTSKDGKEVGWVAMPGYGKTEGSVKPFPVYTDDCAIGEGPWLDYQVYVPAGEAGSYQLRIFFGQSNDISFFEGKELNFGLQINEGNVQRKNALENNYISGNNSNGPWNNNIRECGHVMSYGNITLKEGVNTIRVYAMDQNLLLQKVVVSKSSSFKSSYMGAPQSYLVGDPEPSQQALVYDAYVDHEHQYESKTVEPTCTTAGSSTKTCTICNTAFVVSLPALGHDWDEGVVTLEPTETTPGTKLFTCQRCDATKTKRIPRIGATIPDDIDFTDTAFADAFEIENQASAAIAAGVGLRLTTTTDAFEPCNGQISTFSPKDVVKVSVEGDWEATLEFEADLSGASNGYYQFFGMYAAQGDDYNNMAGIRGGDGALQNFLRVDGAVTADSAELNSSPGIASNGSYWYKLIKDGDVYTCLRSSDGESFTQMFSYADTGIEAEYIVIDAYTGMTQGYAFTLKTLSFEELGSTDVPDEPDPPVVDPPKPGDEVNYALQSNGGSASGSAGIEGSITNVIDGNLTKNSRIRWASENLPASLTITLSELRAIRTVDVVSQMPDSAGDGPTQMGVSTNLGFKGIEVFYSEDGSTWTLFGSGDANNTNAWQQFTKDSPVKAKYIKIDIEAEDTMDGWARVLEVQVLGTPVGAAPCEHDYKAEVTEATCTEEGYTTYTCSKCEDSYKDDEVAALGHDYGEWKITTAATCTEKGVETRECSRCDASETRDIAALGHDYGEWTVTTAATCTEKGVETRECARCDESETRDVAALGHDYGEWTVTTAATCTEKGVETRECSRCDASEIRDIAALGHKFENGVCTVCGAKDDEDVHDCPSKDFIDVPALNDWAHAGIDYCVEEGLMNGTSATLFSPANSLTRAQIATILYRIAGEPEVEYKAVFSDVADGVWYTKAIIWAAEEEIVNGYPGGTFAPNKAISREQIATILYRYFGSPASGEDLKDYPDADSVSDWAKAAMAWAVEKGLINGIKSDDISNLAPQKNATRAQFATIIMRFQALKAE